MRCHFRCKIDDRYKSEQGAEKVDKVWDKIQVIVENYFVERSLAADKVINVFRNIENNNNYNYQRDRKKKSA